MGGRHWEGNLLYQNVQSGHSSTKQNETKKKKTEKPVRKRQKACGYSDGNHDAMMRRRLLGFNSLRLSLPRQLVTLVSCLLAPHWPDVQ